MTIKRTAILLSLSALFAGCASSPTTIAIAPPSEQTICCRDFSEFPYAQLGDNETLKFDIDQNSPVAKFPSGNSYFSAFKLSDRASDTFITVSGLMIDDSVFAPELILLDENFNKVEIHLLDEFEILPSDAFTRTRYIARFRIDATKTPFFIVYTPADQLGKTVKVDHPAKRRAIEFGEVMPMVTDPSYTHQLGGTVEVEVETLKMRPFRQTKPNTQNVDAPTVSQLPTIQAQPETQSFYFNAIKDAVEQNDLDKALALLEEAKSLNISGAQQAFVEAVNKKNQ